MEKEYKFVRSVGGVTVEPPSGLRTEFNLFVKDLVEVYNRPTHSFFTKHHYVKVNFSCDVVDPRPDGFTPYGVELFSPLFFTSDWKEYLFVITPLLSVRREKETESYIVIRLFPSSIRWVLPYPLPPPSLLMEMDPTTYEPRTLQWIGPFSVGIVSRYAEVERKRMSPAAGLVLSRIFLIYLLTGHVKFPTLFTRPEEEEGMVEEEELVWSWLMGIVGNQFLMEERVISCRLLWDAFQGVFPRRRFEHEIPTPIPINRINEILYSFKVCLSFASHRQLPLPSVEENRVIP